MSHRAKARLQQQQLRARIRLPSGPERIVLTCRCNPGGLFRVVIECRCNKQNTCSEEENCGNFEKPHEYNARSPSMIDQEPLWNIYRTQSIIFIWIELLRILPAFEGV